MPRAAWNGSISFGLVQIPVELFAGDEGRELSFTMLDKRDLSPIGYQRINKTTGQVVPYDLIVKGYEHSKGEYVVLQPSDFLKANVEATQTIDIQDFVPADEISEVFFQRPYYVKPKKTGLKAYEVLRAALARTGRAGIATVVLHTRQHLAALIAEADVLVLELLRFADEVRDGREIVGAPSKAPAVTQLEQTMAEQLIEGMAGTWEPGKYRDTYREDLMKLIEERIAAGQVNVVGTDEAPVAPPVSPRGGVVDLVALLRRSIDARPAQAGTGDARPARNSDKAAPAGRRHGAGREPKGRPLRRSA
jgi:DNA end-binding protein Ku